MHTVETVVSAACLIAKRLWVQSQPPAICVWTFHDLPLYLWVSSHSTKTYIKVRCRLNCPSAWMRDWWVCVPSNRLVTCPVCIPILFNLSELEAYTGNPCDISVCKVSMKMNEYAQLSLIQNKENSRLVDSFNRCSLAWLKAHSPRQGTGYEWVKRGEVREMVRGALDQCPATRGGEGEGQLLRVQRQGSVRVWTHRVDAQALLIQTLCEKNLHVLHPLKLK